MSRYKSHMNDRNKVLEQKYLEEQRVPIQGRVDIKSICECALYLKERGMLPSTRSGLVSAIMEGFAASMKAQNKVVEIPTAEMAYRELSKMGLGWEQGTKSHKRVLKVMQEESIDLDSRGDITDDDVREGVRLYREMMRKQRDEKNAGAIAPKLPTGMIARTDEDGNIIRSDEDESKS